MNKVQFYTATGIKIVLPLQPECRIGKVKQLLSEKININPSSMILFFKSYCLSDELAIRDLNLEESSVIGIRCHASSMCADNFSVLEPNNQETINRLKEYGFSHEKCLNALKKRNNNFEAALEFLLSSNDNDNDNDDENDNENENNNYKSEPKDNSPEISLAQRDQAIDRLMNIAHELPRAIVITIFENAGFNEDKASIEILQMC